MRGTKCHCGADSWGRLKDQYPDMCFDCLACLHCSPEAHWCDPAGPPEPCDCIWQEPHDPNCSYDARMQSWEAKQYRNLIAELARWKDLYTEAASIINWGTTCASCARQLDRSYDDYCKLEELTAERDAALAKIQRVLTVCDEEANHGARGDIARIDLIRAALAGPEDRNEP